MLRVLTYHRVADPEGTPWLNPSLISAAPAAFEEQARHLARRYRVVSMDEALSALGQRRNLSPRSVLITFDDAYRDFGEVAWPILRRYRLPTTLFVPTAYPGEPARQFWWDRLHQAVSLSSVAAVFVPGVGELALNGDRSRRQALRRVQQQVKSMPHAQGMVLVEQICQELGQPGPAPRSVHTWDELRELADDGVTLASHTRTHPLLTRLPPGEARAEIRESRSDLIREIGYAPPVFCYPAGAHNGEVVQILREEKFAAAVTVLDGQNDLQTTDPLLLRRTNITPRTSLALFRLRLHRWASAIDRWRHAAAPQELAAAGGKER